MPDPLTTNKSLAQPTRGSDVGTWDTPMNANSGIIDNSFGGAAVLTLSNSNVVLSSAQYQCFYIGLNGTLSANVILTFPGGIGSFYVISNACITTASSFTVTMQTTASGGGVIGIPPSQQTHVGISGALSTPLYLNLPHHVGAYWEFAGGAVPTWVSACTTPPYLNCDGTTFSSATYPQLATYLGGTALPDARGRLLFALDQGTGRLAGAGFLSGGGSITIGSSNLPAHSHPVSDPGHTHPGSGGLQFAMVGSGNAYNVSGAAFGVGATNTGSNTTGLTVSNSTYANSAYAPPYLIHGITMIRAG